MSSGKVKIYLRKVESWFSQQNTGEWYTTVHCTVPHWYSPTPAGLVLCRNRHHFSFMGPIYRSCPAHLTGSVADSKLLRSRDTSGLTLLQLHPVKDPVLINWALKFFHYINLSTWVSKYSGTFLLPLFIMPGMPTHLSFSLCLPFSLQSCFSLILLLGL